MRINIIEKKILEVLFKARYKLSSFTLFQRSRVSFPVFMRGVQGLEKKGMLSIDENYISLEKEGIRVALSLPYFMERKEWRTIPDSFVGLKIDKDSFYVPNRNLLDKDLH